MRQERDIAHTTTNTHHFLQCVNLCLGARASTPLSCQVALQRLQLCTRLGDGCVEDLCLGCSLGLLCSDLLLRAYDGPLVVLWMVEKGVATR